MFPISKTAAWGLALAVGLGLLAAVSALRQWRGRRDRAEDLHPADAAFFHRQDRRRLLAAFVMAAVVAGMVYGLSLNPKANRLQAELFVAVWCGVLVLLLWLVILAVLDWLATRGYARRHRQALIEEARALAEAERRLREQRARSRPSAPGDPGV
jgi:hypothetical protein